MEKKMIFMMLLLPVLLNAQEERKYIREGYKAYMDENFTEAEVDFRKAEEVSDNSFTARYNTSTALYQQDKLEESGERFAELSKESSDPADQAKLLHNLGNVMLKSQQYQQAVEAYKQSLKLNPGDEDTRYNLAYALEKLREQQQQEQNKNQQEQQQNQDERQKNQEQQEQKQNSEQQKQQQNQEEQERQQQQPRKQELSKEEAERLLNAILQKEKDVKEKVDKQKAKAAKIRTDKEW